MENRDTLQGTPGYIPGQHEVSKEWEYWLGHQTGRLIRDDMVGLSEDEVVTLRLRGALHLRAKRNEIRWKAITTGAKFIPEFPPDQLAERQRAGRQRHEQAFQQRMREARRDRAFEEGEPEDFDFPCGFTNERAIMEDSSDDEDEGSNESECVHAKVDSEHCLKCRARSQPAVEKIPSCNPRCEGDSCLASCRVAEADAMVQEGAVEQVDTVMEGGPVEENVAVPSDDSEVCKYSDGFRDLDSC
jgi:hypothetical protein